MPTLKIGILTLKSRIPSKWVKEGENSLFNRGHAEKFLSSSCNRSCDIKRVFNPPPPEPKKVLKRKFSLNLLKIHVVNLTSLKPCSTALFGFSVKKRDKYSIKII